MHKCIQWSLTYPDTWLGTNPHSSTESDSLIRKCSYPDSQSWNGGVRISEAPLYNIILITTIQECEISCLTYLELKEKLHEEY